MVRRFLWKPSLIISSRCSPSNNMTSSKITFYIALATMVLVTIWWVANTTDDALHSKIMKVTLPIAVPDNNVTTEAVHAPVLNSCYNLDRLLKLQLSSKPFTFYPVGSQDLFVFSAFGDTRFGSLIRFVGLGIHRKYNGLKCVLLHGREVTQLHAEVEFLPEGHRLKYDAVFINCRTNSSLSLSANSFVGLSERPCSTFAFLLPLEILSLSAPKPATSGLTACVPPLHSAFDDMARFVEFVELNRLLGVQRFVVYNYSVGGNLSRALGQYETAGLLSVIPWRLPVASGSKYPFPPHYRIHYFGQLVAIHDCLLRAMNRPFRFIAFQDIDEFLVPRTEPTLLPLLRLMVGQRTAGLSFANAKFHLSFNASERRLASMEATRRHAAVLPHGDRSKMIVDAERVAIMGVHFVWKYINATTRRLGPREALLHHYRKWGPAKHWVTDATALRFKAQLASNFDAFFRNLEE